MNIGITVHPTYRGGSIVGSVLGKELAERGHTVHFHLLSFADAVARIEQARPLS